MPSAVGIPPWRALAKHRAVLLSKTIRQVLRSVDTVSRTTAFNISIIGRRRYATYPCECVVLVARLEPAYIEGLFRSTGFISFKSLQRRRTHELSNLEKGSPGRLVSVFG